MNREPVKAPKILTWLFRLFTEPENAEYLYADICEIYAGLIKEKGRPYAGLWLVSHTFISIVQIALQSLRWSIYMLNNYVKLVCRSLGRSKLNTVLNITGLAAGIAAGLLIFTYIRLETGYEKHIPSCRRIYRVTHEFFTGTGTRSWAATAFPLAAGLRDAIPEIERTARLYSTYSRVFSNGKTGADRKAFEEERGFYADPDAAGMFAFKFIEGNPETALSEPDGIVLTRSMAQKYFGTDHAVGNTIEDISDKRLYTITGVIEDLPATSHMQSAYFLSMATCTAVFTEDGRERLLENRTWNALYTYVMLRQGIEPKQLEGKLDDFTAGFYAFRGSRKEVLEKIAYRLQPIAGIHLHSQLEKEMGPNGRIEYIYIFGISAILIILIACVNFINITTAQMLKRFKEVGIRKVVGARRGQLIAQLLAESVVLTVLSAVAAAAVIAAALSEFNSITGYALHFADFFSGQALLVLLVSATVIAVSGGLYPALFASGFSPSESLKPGSVPAGKVSRFRNGLVIFQFAISVFMIFASLVIHRQLQYFHAKDLGFDKDSLIGVKLYGDLVPRASEDFSALKKNLLQYSQISGITKANKLPGDRFGRSDFRIISGADPQEPQNMRFMYADEDFVETFKLHILQGTSFAGRNPAQKLYILNETAANLLGSENPVGMKFHSGNGNEEGIIVGVVKDFHYSSLHNTIDPLVINLTETNASYLFAAYRPGTEEDVLSVLRRETGRIAPEQELVYTFIDRHMDQLYGAENKMSAIFSAFTVLAVAVSCLGLFGISAFLAKRKIKEIGIRKVHGARTTNILLVLSKNYILWITAANCIALPAAWYCMNRWLDGFAYRTGIGPGPAVFTLLLSILSSAVTISYWTVRSARSNPVTILKYE